MTRRNDKRNNRRNRQRNNNSELPELAQMIMGAILSKGTGMITEALMKKEEEKTEGKPHTGIRQSGNLLESLLVLSMVMVPQPRFLFLMVTKSSSARMASR